MEASNNDKIDIIGRALLSDTFNTVVKSSQIIAGIGAASILTAGAGMESGFLTVEMFQAVLEPAILAALPTVLLTHLRGAARQQYAYEAEPRSALEL